MPLLDPIRRSIALKFVYYGPTGVGKTASLKLLAQRLRLGQRLQQPLPGLQSGQTQDAGSRCPGSLLCLDTAGERTLFFDALSMAAITKIDDQDVRLVLRLFSVPGEDIHRHTRRLILRGADGVVLVGAGDVAMAQAREAALGELRSSLREWGISFDKLPVAMQPSPRGPTADRDIVEVLLSLLQASWPTVQQSAESAGLSGLELPRFLCVLRRALCAPSTAEAPSPNASEPAQPSAVAAALSGEWDAGGLSQPIRVTS